MKSREPQQKYASYSYTDWNGVTTTVAQPFQTGFMQFVGGNDKNWRMKVAAGINCTNTMVSKYVDTGWASFSVSCRHPTVPGDTYNARGNHLGLYVLNVEFSTQQETGRTQDDGLIQATKSLRSNFAAGTFAGELRKSLASIRSPAKSLVDWTVRHAKLQHRHGSVYKHKRDLLKAYGDTYLEWSFGFKPLASDLAEAAISHYNTVNRERFQRFSSNVYRDITVPESLIGTWQPGGIPIRVDIFRKGTIRIAVKIRGCVKLKPSVNSMAFNFGISPPDFVPNLYNLMPWSWLADYFTNVGDVLNCNATLAQLEEPVWVSQTTAVTHTAEARFSCKGVNGYVLMDNNWPTATGITKRVTRLRMGSFSSPAARTKVDLNFSKIANLAALASSQNYNLFR